MYNDWSILCFSAGDNSEKSEDASARLSSCIHKLFACFESLAQRFKTTVSLSKYLNTKLRKSKITRPWIQMLFTPAPKSNSNVVRYARINSYFLSNEHLWDVLGTDKIWKTQIDMTLLNCRSATTCINCYLNAPTQLAEIVYPLPQIPAVVFHACAHYRDHLEAWNHQNANPCAIAKACAIPSLQHVHSCIILSCRLQKKPCT
jgi:hypothetical protein